MNKYTIIARNTENNLIAMVTTVEGSNLSNALTSIDWSNELKFKTGIIINNLELSIENENVVLKQNGIVKFKLECNLNTLTSELQ